MATSTQCHNCGSPLRLQQRFCTSCGTPVRGAAPPAPQRVATAAGSETSLQRSTARLGIPLGLSTLIGFFLAFIVGLIVPRVLPFIFPLFYPILDLVFAGSPDLFNRIAMTALTFGSSFIVSFVVSFLPRRMARR